MSKEARPQRADLSKGTGLEPRGSLPQDSDSSIDQTPLTTSATFSEPTVDAEVTTGQSYSNGNHSSSGADQNGSAEESPYDRWRNYVPESMSRPEPAETNSVSAAETTASDNQHSASFDPLDFLNEPAAAQVASGKSDSASPAPFVRANETTTSLPTVPRPAAFESRLVSGDPAHMEPVGSPFGNLDRYDAELRGLDPADIAPSRKLETPDMLRWRAEMLLDEMMVGAVDTSAGAGERTARPATFADSAMLDTALPAPSARTETHTEANRATTPASVAPAASFVKQSAATTTSVPVDTSAVTAEQTIVSASVRAALPPRSPTRIATPIVREQSTLTSDSASANGTSANGSSANGTGRNGNGANGHTASDHLAEHFASDYQKPANGNGNGAGNGAGHNGITTNGNGHTGYKLDGATERTSDQSSELNIADDGRPSNDSTAAQERRTSDTASTAAHATITTGNFDEATGLTRGAGFVLASQQYDSSSTTPRTPALPSVDPLDDLDAYPPLPSSAYAPERSPAPTGMTSYSTDASISASSPARPPVETQQSAPLRTLGASSSSEGTSSNLRSVDTIYPSAVERTSLQSAVQPYPASEPRPTYEQRPAPDQRPATDQRPPNPQRLANEQTARKLTAVEQRYPKSAQPALLPTATQSAPVVPVSGKHNDAYNDEPFVSGLGPVRINPAVLNSASITGAMSIGNRAHSRYASLLPRATPWDLHEMEREIYSLQEEMARVMPSGHESSRRAHHLLEKAQTIFVGDPLRSAEVDYYLTQVRAIVQRSRQTMQWSESYRAQLNKYHIAWIVLSALMLVLGVAFGDQVTAWAIAFFGLNPTGVIATYAAPAVVTMFAGSLGASIGALLNIRRFHRLNLGYFDRKYSLRGLMLPIIGLLGGLAFSILFATLYWVLGTVAPLPLLLEMLPPMLAFGLGFLQESIYGTRD